VAILIIGVPANSSLTGKFDINTIDLDSVERIEVIYGGSDTKYNVSGAMGGVINIITIKKQEKGLRGGAKISNTGYLSGAYTRRDGGVGETNGMVLLDTQMAELNMGYGAEKRSLSLNIFGDVAGNQYRYKDYYGYARSKESNNVKDIGAALSSVWDLPDGWSRLLTLTDVYHVNKNIPVSGTARLAVNQRDTRVWQNLVFDAPRFFHDTLASELTLSYSWTVQDFFESGKKNMIHDVIAINRWTGIRSIFSSCGRESIYAMIT
jgi:vitamin B12 transporter